MTRIRATCPTCGEVDLRPEDIRLYLVPPPGEDEGVGEGSTYTFSCPVCNGFVSKPADERVAQLLETGGVPIRVGGPPVSDGTPLPEHPEEALGGPPLTYDDLLDLHLLLESDGWFKHLLATRP